jgi:hypothetical protein
MADHIGDQNRRDFLRLAYGAPLGRRSSYRINLFSFGQSGQAEGFLFAPDAI